MGAHHRSVAWSKDDPPGNEYAEFELAADRLRIEGVAIGSAPLGYRLDYELDTAAGFVTTRLQVVARGDGWRRAIELRRTTDGGWSCNASADGELDLPAPGAPDMAPFEEALDPDLALSPATNSIPVLRHGLLDRGRSPELVMVWISVPDLALHRSPQRYEFARSLDARRRAVSFVAPNPDEGDFVAEIVFDDDGIVVDYPGIATRL